MKGRQKLFREKKINPNAQMGPQKPFKMQILDKIAHKLNEPADLRKLLTKKLPYEIRQDHICFENGKRKRSESETIVTFGLRNSMFLI